MAVSSCEQSIVPFWMVTSPLFTSNALPLPPVPVRVIVFPPRSMVSVVFAPRFGSTRASSVTLSRSRTVEPSTALATAAAREA